VDPSRAKRRIHREERQEHEADQTGDTFAVSSDIPPPSYLQMAPCEGRIAAFIST
jgi:hypothetical protein